MDYTNHPDSNYVHLGTSLGNIDNKVLAVGGVSWYEHEVHEVPLVEIFDINSNAWTSKTSFPYCNESRLVC